MSLAPLLTIAIPAFGRPADLRTTLAKLRDAGFFARWPILVVDDGSPTEEIRAVCAEFPAVRYIRIEQNVGLIAARNLASQLCETTYMLNLDDDSWPEDLSSIDDAVSYLEDNPRVGVLALNIRTKSGIRWNYSEQPKAVRTYVGCGNIYRLSLIPVVGEYEHRFVRQGEEIDRCVRIYDANFCVISFPSAVIYHDESVVNRNMRAHVARESANYLRRELLRTPMLFLPHALLRWTTFTIRRVRSMDTTLLMRELLRPDGFSLREVWQSRRPVSVAGFRRFMRLPNW